MLLPEIRYDGPPVHVYRGTTANERRRHLYGFFWTADRGVAERFAEQHRNPDGAVLLETVADPSAMLFIREHIEGYYEEEEYILDPYKLTQVKVLMRLPPDRP